MRSSLLLLSGLQLASAAKCHSGKHKPSVGTNSTKLAVTILADTNRDGKVDITGDTDLVGKETWTDQVGALFLANIVDTDGRCSSQITGQCGSELGAIFNETQPPEVPVLDTKLFDQPADPKEVGAWLQGLDEDKRNAVSDFWVSGQDEYVKVDEVDRKISACNDASDNILRNATYLAPLRTRPIPGLSDSATGTVAVTRIVAATKVRIFHKPSADGEWQFVAANHTFTAAELKAGLELGIDGRDVRRPGGWDGRATVEFKVKDGSQEARDTVALRVAPVLTQHHGHAVKQLLANQYQAEESFEFIKQTNAERKRFVADFRKATAPTDLRIFEDCDEDWMQDIVEPGYMSIPGPDGGRPVGLHIMIRSAQSAKTRNSGRLVFSALRSGTVGAVQHLADGDTTDSTGNLETIPPHQSAAGKSFPAGRTVMGSQDAKKPHIFAFLEAQEAQTPIELDTTWLSVGHTDEFVQFLPSESAKLGWVLMVNDPRLGVQLLKKAQAAGHGKQRAASRPHGPADPERWDITTTIDELAEPRFFERDQNATAGHIDRNVEILKRETGLTDEDIIRLPGMYQLDDGYNVPSPWKYDAPPEKASSADAGEAGAKKPGKDAATRRRRDEAGEDERAAGGILSVLDAGTPPSLRKALAAAKAAAKPHGEAGALRRRDDTIWKVGALYPDVINSVVLDNKTIIAPNPWGPVIDGKDIIAAAAEEAYAKAGYKVRFVDNWFSHHKKLGEVHCATNVIRHLTDDKWW